MDQVLRQQFLDALRTDLRFRAAVLDELVGAGPALPAVVDDLRATVATLVDVVAEQRRDLELLASARRAGGAAVRKDLATLAVGLGELRARVAALEETTAGHAGRLEALAEASAPVLPLVQGGFVAIRDALSGLVAGMQATQRELAALRDADAAVVDLRDPAPAPDSRPA